MAAPHVTGVVGNRNLYLKKTKNLF
jgi:hypothetical protein